MSALFQLANTCMNMISSAPLLVTEVTQPNTDLKDNWAWVLTIINAINQLLYPILILVGSAGVIYAVYLGVQLARADSADKQQEAKKRMINAIIGLASIIALILLLKLFCQFLPTWIKSGMYIDTK